MKKLKPILAFTLTALLPAAGTNRTKMKTLNRSTLILALAALASSLLFILPACEKEGPPGPAGAAGAQGEQGPKGETGAAGPKGDKGAAGPKGATGAQGSKGDKGEKGDTGTANVIYSQWLGIEFTQAVFWHAEIQTAKITPDIINKGMVLVYFKASASNAPVYKLNYNLGNTFLIQSIAPGQIILNASQDYSDPNYQFRYVIVPGSVLSPHLKFNPGNYNEVMNILDIQP